MIDRNLLPAVENPDGTLTRRVRYPRPRVKLPTLAIPCEREVEKIDGTSTSQRSCILLFNIYWDCKNMVTSFAGTHLWKTSGNGSPPDRVRPRSFSWDSIQPGMTNAIEKINIDTIETRIYSDSRANLLIMISIIRIQRAGLIPHLLTSGLISGLLVFVSSVN
jgi:hypothetical protein